MKRRRLVASVFAGGFASGFAISTGAQTPVAGGTREIEDVRGTQVVPASPQAIVCLGEEYLLADVLELGFKPVAAAGNYEAEYVGIDPALTEGLEPFTMWELDIEAISQNPMDLILVPEVYYTSQQDGFNLIAELAPMVVIPTNSDWRENFLFLASVFGKELEANQKIADLEADIEQTAAELALEGCSATFATIYPGESEITLWLNEDLMIVEVGMKLGLTVVPNDAEYEPDQIGRARISLEQLQVMQGDTLLMLQTTGGLAPEEDQSFQELQDLSGFQSLPAVQNDQVFVLERVGFPGDVPGRRNLLARYREIFGS